VKKFLSILALVAATSAFAETNGINVEFERDRGTQSPNTMSNTIKLAPYVKFDNGVKADIQVTANRNDGTVSGNNNALTNTAEARVQKMYEVYPGLHLGARVGLGEVFNGTNKAGNTTDFGYYTIEPKADYMLTDKLSALASWKYRDTFGDNQAYLTRTWKAGFGYDVTKKDLVEVKYVQQRGDFKTNGVELGYTRGF
jgi:hypothetical protein